MSSPHPSEADGSAAHSPTAALSQGFDLAEEPASAVLDPGAVRPAGRSGAALEGAQARQGFAVGSLDLMVRYIDGSELTELPQVHRLPNAPPWLRGMANLHGALVPVFDPALWLGVERAADAKPMLLVLGHGSDAAGIVIDGLPSRLRFSPGDVIEGAAVPGVLTNIVQRVATVGGRVWYDLDSHALLAELEAALGPAQ